MARGWTWIDEDTEKDEAEIDKITPLLDALAGQWSALTEGAERKRFARQSDMEEGRDYEFESEADEFQFKELEKLRGKIHDSQVATVEAALASHGARMMRPYEHWNEDEQLVAWQERDRDGE